MNTDEELRTLLAQANQHAEELDRTLASMHAFVDMPVAFSRSALVDELGFDASAQTVAPQLLHAIRG